MLGTFGMEGGGKVQEECEPNKNKVYRRHDEVNLQNEIRIALSKHGAVFRMNTGYFQTKTGAFVKCGFPGMSDLLFVGQGFIAWIEVKAPKGVESKNQKNFIKFMKDKGHKAGFAYSVDDALKIIGEGKI